MVSPATNGVLRALVAVLALGLLACEQESAQKTPKKAAIADGGRSGTRCDPETERCETTGRDRTSRTRKDDPDRDPYDPKQWPEEDLPAYLMTSREAAAVKKLVDPYQEGTQEYELQGVSTRYSKFREFTEDLLNDAMRIPALKPGRRFDVSIIDSDDVNAWADAFQRIGINTKTVSAVAPDIMFYILCHEITHSTKNHAAGRENVDMGSAAEQRAIKDAEDAASVYLTATYDLAGSTYTHDAAKYRTARAAWEKAAKPLSRYYKKQESEADVIGMMICAELGMPPADYVDARFEFSRRLKKLYGSDGGGGGGGGITDAKDLGDGESFSVDLATLSAFLFPVDSHPSEKERNEQIERVEAIAKRHLSKETFYDDWMKGAKRASGGAMSLVDQPLEIPAPLPKIVTTSSGKIITIPTKGCHH